GGGAAAEQVGQRQPTQAIGRARQEGAARQVAAVGGGVESRHGSVSFVHERNLLCPFRAFSFVSPIPWALPLPPGRCPCPQGVALGYAVPPLRGEKHGAGSLPRRS